MRRGAVQPRIPATPKLVPEIAATGGLPLDALRDALATRVKDELAVRWSELLAIETVADEVVQVFQDAVVVPERMRSLLQRARSELQRLHEHGAELLELEPLPDAEESFVDLLRKGLKRDQHLYA